MILAPLFDLTLLIRPWGTPLQDYETAAPAVPKTGSALHHLVTSVSVKKALTVRDGIDALFFDRSGRNATTVRHRQAPPPVR
jgi:hypothetical protein